MALTPEEIEVVRELRQKGYTSTQIKGFISGERLGAKPSTVAMQETQTAPETRFGDVGEDLVTGAKQLGSDFMSLGRQNIESVKAGASGEQSLLETGAQTALSVGGGVGSIIGRGIQTAAKLFMKPSEEKAAGDAISGAIQKTGIPDKVAELSPRTQRNVQAGVNALELFGVKGTGGLLSKGTDAFADIATRVGSDVADNLSRVGRVGSPGITRSIDLGISPEDLMQRVARVSKGKQANFEERAGESIGSYLVNRKIFGGPDEITEQLYENMKLSKGRVDAGLSRVQGTTKNDAVQDALEQLAERETRVSSTRVLSPDKRRVDSLLAKHQKDGLTLSEINEVKRLYERNVKVDYMRDNVSDKIALANNVDSALRKLVEDTAAQGGFPDVRTLNRETMLAKQLLDDIGAEYAGQAGNNLVSLSDAFFLAEAAADPRALLAFGIKKTFGSKDVMSSVARYMARNRQKKDMPSGQIQDFQRLPAGPENPQGFRSVSSAENSINLPERPQSTLDAQERTNPGIKQPERPETTRPSVSKELQDIEEEAVYQVRTEMLELSRPGERIVLEPDATRNGPGVIGVPSTFPKWVPDNLRSSELFARTWKHIDNNTTPKPNAHNEWELYSIVKSEIAKREFNLQSKRDNWQWPDGKPVNFDDIPFSFLIATGGAAGAYYLYDGEGSMPMAAMVGLIAMTPAKRLKFVQRQIDDVDRMIDKNMASGMKTSDPNYKSLMEARRKLVADRDSIPN